MAQIVYSDVPERSALEKLITLHNALVADVAAIRTAAATSLAAVAATVPTTDTITLKH